MTGDDLKDELTALEPTDEEFAQANKKDLRKLESRDALIQALRNLLDEKPTKEALKQLLAEEGWLPITKDTVEIEAGVNRRLFSGEKSEHPEISELLKRIKPDFGVLKTTTERLTMQGERIRLLEQRLTASRSATAAQCHRIEALSLQLRSANARIKRLKAGETEDRC